MAARAGPDLILGSQWDALGNWMQGHPLNSIDNPGIMSSTSIQGLIPIGSLQERQFEMHETYFYRSPFSNSKAVNQPNYPKVVDMPKCSSIQGWRGTNVT